MIKEIIVVEGKEDTRRLKEIFKDINTIETRGSAISESTLKLIEKAQQTRGVIIFTDPDYPGKRIRSIITERVKGCKHAYIEKKKAISKKKNKVGIEHCSKDDIIHALNNITQMNDIQTDVSYNDLVGLGLVGTTESKKIREYISNKLNIGHNNAKQFYKKVQFFNISFDELVTLIKSYNKENMEV